MQKQNKSEKKETEEISEEEIKSISGGVDFTGNEITWSPGELEAVLKKIDSSPDPNKAALAYFKSISARLGGGK